MMTKLLFSLALFASVQSLHADWVIIQKTATDGKDKQMTMKVKDNKIRNDIGKDMSVLVDGNDNSSLVLMHSNKMVMRVSQDAMKTVGTLASSLAGGDNKPSKPKATGEKVKVGEWDTEVFTWEGKLGTGKFYVARSFPKFEELNKALDQVTKSMSNPMSSLFPQNADFPGMVVKSEMTMMGKATTSELVSATEQPVSADDFKTPEGYQEMKMPKLPGGPQAK